MWIWVSKKKNWIFWRICDLFRINWLDLRMYTWHRQDSSKKITEDAKWISTNNFINPTSKKGSVHLLFTICEPLIIHVSFLTIKKKYFFYTRIYIHKNQRRRNIFFSAGSCNQRRNLITSKKLFLPSSKKILIFFQENCISNPFSTGCS